MPSNTPAQTAQSEASAKGLEDHINHWIKEVDKALKREESYRKEAKEFLSIYEGRTETPFNILYANTETLSPAIYNSAPRPDTRPRARQPSPVAEAAAGLVDAYLTEFIDHGDARYCSFDETIRTGLDQALVPGRGAARFHYRADVEYEGKGEDRTPRRVRDELVYAEPLDWDKFCYGYAKSWKAVPWFCFIHEFTKDQAIEELGSEAAAKLNYTSREEGEEDGARKDPDSQEATATSGTRRRSRSSRSPAGSRSGSPSPWRTPISS
jgi:hypothetical protein